MTPSSPTPEYVPPANCRQRLSAEGKAYPRSSCAVCGQLSPRWKECDAALAAAPEPAEPSVCTQYRPGTPCPVPASCRDNGCSAVERELYPTEPSVPADGVTTLKRVGQFLHAAYDRPPQTPETRALLAAFDTLANNSTTAAAGVDGRISETIKRLTGCKDLIGYGNESLHASIMQIAAPILAQLADAQADAASVREAASNLAWHRDGIGPDVPVLQERYDDLRAQLADVRAENERLRDDLRFVERWANHHAQHPRTTAAEALSVIQHYPPIITITKSYADGVVPATRNPWAELEAAERDARELREAGAALVRAEDAYHAAVNANQQAAIKWDAVCAARVRLRKALDTPPGAASAGGAAP
jgi:hypothetical protein